MCPFNEKNMKESKKMQKSEEDEVKTTTKRSKK